MYFRLYKALLIVTVQYSFGTLFVWHDTRHTTGEASTYDNVKI